jgi:hypothetical protein
MKYCPGCGTALKYENAEICPECGCRISGFWSGNRAGFQVIAAICLVAIVILLSLIAFQLIQGIPASARLESSGTLPVTQAVMPGTTNSSDNSLTLVWHTMDDWSGWQHTSTWSGKEVGPCSENGPRITDGHGNTAPISASSPDPRNLTYGRLSPIPLVKAGIPSHSWGKCHQQILRKTGGSG